MKVWENLGKLGKVESLECLERLEKSESFGCLKVGIKRHFFRGDEGVGRGVLLQGAEEAVGLLVVTGTCHCVHNHISSDIFFIKFQLGLALGDMQRNTERYGEMQRDAEERREMQRNAQKCRGMRRNAEGCRERQRYTMLDTYAIGSCRYVIADAADGPADGNEYGSEGDFLADVAVESVDGN